MSVPPFEVSVIWEDLAPIVHLRGELDYGTAPVLHDTFKEVIKDDVKHVTLDLSEVTFIDSEGVKILLRAYKALQARGGKLSIDGCSQFAANVFDVLGMNKYLDINVHRK